MAKRPDDFDANLRSYQRMTLTLFYPPLLSLFSLVSAYFISNYSYYLTYASQRYFAVAFLEPSRGNLTFLSFLPLLYGIAILGLYLYLTLAASKGKFWALLLGAILYLGDGIYGSLLYGTSLYGQMDLGTYVVGILCHVAFLVLYGFAIAKYAKLVRPAGKPRD
jgi:hypothetical protein